MNVCYWHLSVLLVSVCFRVTVHPSVSGVLCICPDLCVRIHVLSYRRLSELCTLCVCACVSVCLCVYIYKSIIVCVHLCLCVPCIYITCQRV